MSTSALRALLGELLAATPEPPPVDGEASAVVVAAEAMLARRQPVFERLRQALEAALEALAGDAAASETFHLIRDRSEGWDAALQRSRVVLRQRMAAARRITPAP